MIYTGIRQLCAMSLLCGAALTLTPQGGAKRVTEILCTAVLVLTVLSPLKELDIDAYALSNAKYRETEAELFRKGEDAGERLNRLVIEREYESYIMDKGKNLGLTITKVKIQAEWSLDGLWIPYGAEVYVQGNSTAKDELGRILREDLGIPFERQQWYED